jgi:3-hydroxybutyryl-CoA dehydrogenase
MKLVEVIKGGHTAEETVELLMDFAKSTGKTPIRVNKEIDGFVVNRILRAIRDEAFYLIEQGVCSPQDLDTGVELGLNHPMGPFRLLDLTGIDLNYMSGMRRLEETGIKPNGFDIVKEMYEKKEWGRKTGKGFYVYEKK